VYNDEDMHFIDETGASAKVSVGLTSGKIMRIITEGDK
jgi:hypothetical protein